MDAGQAFMLVETVATIFMAGVLWTMQLLNYPLLSLVGRDAFTRYETPHNRRVGLVVFPGVLAALAGAIGLLASRPGQIPLWAPAVEVYRAFTGGLNSRDLATAGQPAGADGWREAGIGFARRFAGWPPRPTLMAAAGFDNPTVRSQRWAKRYRPTAATASSPTAASSAG